MVFASRANATLRGFVVFASRADVASRGFVASETGVHGAKWGGAACSSRALVSEARFVVTASDAEGAATGFVARASGGERKNDGVGPLAWEAEVLSRARAHDAVRVGWSRSLHEAQKVHHGEPLPPLADDTVGPFVLFEDHDLSPDGDRPGHPRA